MFLFFLSCPGGTGKAAGFKCHAWWNAETLNALRIWYANRDNGIKYREYKA
jgi:hypothetical protein